MDRHLTERDFERLIDLTLLDEVDISLQDQRRFQHLTNCSECRAYYAKAVQTIETLEQISTIPHTALSASTSPLSLLKQVIQSVKRHHSVAQEYIDSWVKSLQSMDITSLTRLHENTELRAFATIGGYRQAELLNTQSSAKPIPVLLKRSPFPEYDVTIPLEKMTVEVTQIELFASAVLVDCQQPKNYCFGRFDPAVSINSFQFSNLKPGHYRLYLLKRDNG